MKIYQISNTNFTAGTVQLKRVKQSKIDSFESIKKIAEEKNIDILISKNHESKYIPHEDLYMIMASKEVKLVTRGFFNIGHSLKHGMSCFITNKKIPREELAVKMFNAVMKAVETLENNCKVFK